jgi:hypothetical protein
MPFTKGLPINNASAASAAAIAASLGFTPGSVVFMGAVLLAEDNAAFFWERTLKQLYLGSQTPSSPARLAITGDAGAGSAAYPTLAVIGGAQTGIAVESRDVFFNLARSVTIGNGRTIANQRAVYITAPTYPTVSTTSTLIVAATVAISGAPIAGAGTTIGAAYALLIESGNLGLLAGAIQITLNNLLATLTPGLSLINQTVAIAGAGNQQNSPSIYWQGSNFNTVTVAACPVKFQSYIKAGSVAEPQGVLSWAAMVGAEVVYTDRMQVQVFGAAGVEFTALNLISSGDRQLVEFYKAGTRYASIESVSTHGLYIMTRANLPLNFLVNAALGWTITVSAHWQPNTDGSNDLGGAAARVRCVYTGSDAIGVGTTCGLSLVNKTLATNILNQYGPLNCGNGSGWDTGTAAPVALGMGWQQQSVAANPVVNKHVLMRKRAAGAWGASGFAIDDLSRVYLTSALAPATPAAGDGVVYLKDNGVATPNRKTQFCMKAADGGEVLIAESAAF